MHIRTNATALPFHLAISKQHSKLALSRHWLPHCNQLNVPTQMSLEWVEALSMQLFLPHSAQAKKHRQQQRCMMSGRNQEVPLPVCGTIGYPVELHKGWLRRVAFITMQQRLISSNRTWQILSQTRDGLILESLTLLKADMLRCSATTFRVSNSSWLCLLPFHNHSSLSP